MDHILTYSSGKPRRRVNVDSMLDAVADQVLSDGDVEKALQRAFRFGTENDFGLLDVLERLREEIQNLEQHLLEPDQHASDLQSSAAQQRVEDAVAMRDALRQVESLDDLHGLDPEMMQQTLTTDEMEWVDKWSEMTGQLIDSGLIAQSGPRLVLTAKAVRQIGSRLLQHMFLPPVIRGRGEHIIPRPGLHGMPGDDISPWEWGKPFDIHIGRTLTNAIRRTGPARRISLMLNDFEAFDREAGAAVVTVLLADMSRSMFESGAWDATKRAVIALNSLITSSRTHDQLRLVGFSGDARELSFEDLPSLTWDQFSHGTNLHSGLIEAGKLLSRHHGMNRQIVIVTDGEPTAFMDGSNPVFEHPVTERTTDATLLEASRLSRKGINFTIICVGDPASAPDFAQALSRLVGGRLISLPLHDLGAFVVRDVAQGAIRTIR